MDLIDREQALGCFWNYGYDDGTGFDETEMPAYDRLQALPPVAEVEDCISRQAAIIALCKAGCDSGYCGVSCDDVKAIENLPSAQPQRMKSRWVDGRCLRCGEHAPFHSMASAYYESDFCPHCGADMQRGEKDE